MNENADRIPSIEEVLVVSPTEASLRLQVTDLLLGGLCDVRIGRGCPWSSGMSCNE